MVTGVTSSFTMQNKYIAMYLAHFRLILVIIYSFYHNFQFSEKKTKTNYYSLRLLLSFYLFDCDKENAMCFVVLWFCFVWGVCVEDVCVGGVVFVCLFCLLVCVFSGTK